ncbi:putative ADP ribosylation factor family [Trypanosoma vivax]|uniref:ADP-ribosylation factor-like protein n=1 Tax=Trypanosoma vivax (strain Y486) TaxID=1055687 RepID=G0U1T1_TRYVY|nr:hypothetical protein TRVL_06344 [Trypanosoma vivax]KAH8618735.1 putative ADP ribosylation factor family [Trypanosoma vivax]CCC50230.1 conserved hypothetical protein [Trypanosoma vivax Y486]
MLALAWGLYNSIFTEQTYNVLLIGLESSGKTTLTEQLRYTYTNGAVNKKSGKAANVRSRSGDENEQHFNAMLSEESPSMPRTAPLSVMKAKRIRPTVGLNMTQLTHQTIYLRGEATARRAVVQGDSSADVVRESSVLLEHDPLTPHPTPNTVVSSSSPLSTSLVLWDVGGSLRTLWTNYFGPCNGVIFVVDSTLWKKAGDKLNPERSADLESPGCCAMSSSRGPSHPGMGDGSKEGDATSSDAIKDNTPPDSLLDAYARDAEVLREVFAHPLLRDKPLLIASNKIDEADHCSLEELQGALRLIDMALMREAYGESDVQVAGAAGIDALSTAEEANGERKPGHSSAKFTTRGEFVCAATSTSGIGKKFMRLMELSALHGTGVREAMDWLVLNMRENKPGTA